MLGLPGLEGDQTATPGAVAILCMNRHNQLELVDENTIRDARYVICFIFCFDMCCCSALQSSVLRMQVIVANSIERRSLPGWPASAAFIHHEARPSTRGATPTMVMRSSALATLTPATIWT